MTLLRFTAVLAAVFGLATVPGFAQTQSPAPETQTPAGPPPTSSPPAPPPGKVLFSRDAQSPAETPPVQSPQPLTHDDPLHVTTEERTAPTFTAYDLDVHLTPASAGVSTRAVLTIRNDGTAPLTRLVLQISSSLHWDAFSTVGRPIPFTARPVDTDADHTGRVQEAVVTLPQSVAPGGSFSLTALYSGTIPQSADRLIRIGAAANEAIAADWDTIAASGTALRGFGAVLWYPVAAPPLFLGDGARLFEAVGRAKLRESSATVRLRLAIEYTGDPPDAAFFCGRREQLTAISDNRDVPVAESPGIATAEFAARPLGFRTLDLFVATHPPTQVGTDANPGLLSAITDTDDALAAYKAAAVLVEPLLVDWLGPRPQTPLTVLDHPGQPFEDDALVVRPMRAVDPDTLTAPLVHSLTHAWLHSTHPWIDEGLAQFLGLLWIDRINGRAAALAKLVDDAHSLALAEPETPTASSGPAGASLAAATGEVFYRTKAAAVWWMLRGIAGDDALKQALKAYRSDARLDADPQGLQHTLEKFSQKDLAWFFNDWVYRDRGLPDLSIASVTPSPLEAHNGLPAGWLVAVEVRNDGYATAEVPVTVRSGEANETARLRIPGQSSASTRIVFAGTPQVVVVNDGSVPEVRDSVHTRDIVLPTH